MSGTINQGPKEQLILILSDRGFGSEINNLIYSINYSHHKNLDFGVISSFWNFKFKEGLMDYFLFEDYKNPKIYFLLYIYKNFTNNLTLAFRKKRFSEIIQQAIEIFTGKDKRTNIFKENLLSYSFNKTKKILGVESQLTYEVFNDIRNFNYLLRNQNREAFILKMNEILIDFWKLTPEISNAIEDKKQERNLVKLENYAVFHIRRGDKVAQATMEDRTYEVEEYFHKLNSISPTIRTIFLMTDDYNVFLEIEQKFPEYKILTLSDPNSSGHHQDKFNNSPAERKKEAGINLLTELEIARNSQLFIGSNGSNIFRLVEYFKIGGCYDLSNNLDEL